jgi:hypothetical protein
MKLLYILPILFIISTAYAINLEEIETDTLKSFYNANIDKLPDIVKGTFANERINIYIEDGPVYFAVTKDSKITELHKGEEEDRTLDMHVSQNFIAKLLKGNADFESALRSGDIKLKGVGFWNALKVHIANFLFATYNAITGFLIRI